MIKRQGTERTRKKNKKPSEKRLVGKNLRRILLRGTPTKTPFSRPQKLFTRKNCHNMNKVAKIIIIWNIIRCFGGFPAFAH